MPPHRPALKNPQTLVGGIYRPNLLLGRQDLKEPPTKVSGFLLHTLVIWTAAAFGRDPVDNLVRVHDVARLAVNAV